jgi:hypothetical protein
MNEADDPKIAAAIAEERRRNEEAVERHPVVSQEQWLKQRLMLMEKEKQYMRAGAALDEGREKLHIHISGRRSVARGPVPAA